MADTMTDDLRDQIAAALWGQARDGSKLADDVMPVIRRAITEARREALLSAADDWERIGSTEDSRREMDAFAREHYTPGGPSMPTLWLRARAAGEHDTPAGEPCRQGGPRHPEGTCACWHDILDRPEADRG